MFSKVVSCTAKVMIMILDLGANNWTQHVLQRNSFGRSQRCVFGKIWAAGERKGCPLSQASSYPPSHPSHFQDKIERDTVKGRIKETHY